MQAPGAGIRAPTPGCTGVSATQHSRLTSAPASLYLSETDLARGQEK